MLRVEFIGNLGSDPEVRYTQDGKAVVNFRCAVNQRKKKPDGEYEESTEWFRVSCFGWMADMAQERLAKGTRVMVIGRLEIGHYTSRDGDPRTSFEVRPDELQIIAPGRQQREEEETSEGNGSPPAHTRAPAAAAQAPRRSPGAQEPAQELEDLPF